MPEAEIERRAGRRLRQAAHRPHPAQAAGAAFRRRAPARGDRACAGARSRRLPDGRSDLRARCAAARGDPRRAEAHPARARQDADLCHPRPGRGDVGRRPHGDPRKRPHPPGRHAGRDLRPPGQRLCRAPARLADDEHPDRCLANGGGSRRRTARSALPAVRRAGRRRRDRRAAGGPQGRAVVGRAARGARRKVFEVEPLGGYTVVTLDAGAVAAAGADARPARHQAGCAGRAVLRPRPGALISGRAAARCAR